MTEKKNPNDETLNAAIITLEDITTNPSTPKNIKKNLSDLVIELKKQEYSVSVRVFECHKRT